jgi:uncharacterized Rmd1/YagE family protein
MINQSSQIIPSSLQHASADGVNLLTAAIMYLINYGVLIFWGVSRPEGRRCVRTGTDPATIRSITLFLNIFTFKYQGGCVTRIILSAASLHREILV